MRLFESIRGHFALMTGDEFRTLSRGSAFSIARVIPENERQKGWIIELTVGKQGNPATIYVTDLLRIYTWLVSSKWGAWATMQEVDEYAATNCVNQRATSYMLPLLATFDDIETRAGNSAGIRFVFKD